MSTINEIAAALSQEKFDTTMTQIDKSKDDDETEMSSRKRDVNEDEANASASSKSSIMTGTTSVSASIDTVDNITEAFPPIGSTSAASAREATNSFSSTITMNSMDEEKALDQLLDDLSEDEVSIMIGLFGVGCDTGPTKNHDFGLHSTEFHLVTENKKSECNSIPVSRPAACYELFFPSPDVSPTTPVPPSQSQHSINNKVLTGSTGGNDKGLQFPKSLLLYDHPLSKSSFHLDYPDFEPLEFNTDGMVQPRIETTPLAKQQTIKTPFHHSAFAWPMLQLLGEPLPVTLAKEQEMAKKRSEKGSLKPPPPMSLLAGGNQLILASPIKKRALAPREALPNEASAISSSTSSSSIASATTAKTAKVAPATLLPKPLLAGGNLPFLVPPLKKRAYAPRKARPYKASTVGAVCSSTTTSANTTTTRRRTKLAPARKKKTKAKSTSRATCRKKFLVITATNQPNTYMTHPQNMNEELWNQRYIEAQDFVSEHGHCRIPTTYTSNPDLANWAKRQRYQSKIFKKNVLDRLHTPAAASTTIIPLGCTRQKNLGVRYIKCLMTPRRLHKLEAIGFCMDLQATSWERMYERLCDYCRRSNGRTCPSKHFDHELWKWVGTQRYQMKLRKKREQEKTAKPSGIRRSGKITMPSLNQERIFKLNEINFAWNDRSFIEEQNSKY